MINTEIVLWAPPLRFWHGATRGLNPALAGWLADSTARCTGAAAFTFVRTAETDYRQPALFADGRDRTLHPRICPPVRLMV